MSKCKLLSLPLFLLASITSASAQFAHTDHKQIVDAAGKPLLLRAINLGNWLVPEGYMWLFQGGPQSPSEIHALVLELLGPEGSAAFWQKYRENYVTREDIALLHRAGFNAIRVPLHYSLFDSDDSEGFKLLDQLIVWSRAEGLYVVLDLHAAPGGQTGTNIDDSAGYPWLYQSPQEQERLIAVWRRLATHYRDEPAVLGYDLLNEPIPHFPKLTPLNFGRRRMKACCGNTLIFANVMMCRSGWASPGRIPTSGSRNSRKRLKKTTSDGLSGRIRRWKSRRRSSAFSHLLIGERSWSSQSFRAALGTRKNG